MFRNIYVRLGEDRATPERRGDERATRERLRPPLSYHGILYEKMINILAFSRIYPPLGDDKRH